MKRAIVILSALLMQINVLFSQNVITGTLVDSVNNERLSFVNVGLMRAVDSVFVSGAASDIDGNFKIEHVNSGKYIFLVSSIGYQTIRTNIDVTSDLNMGIVKMQPGTTTLDEVVIIEKKPLFANEGEKTLYNVSEDPSVQTGTVSVHQSADYL